MPFCVPPRKLVYFCWFYSSSKTTYPPLCWYSQCLHKCYYTVKTKIISLWANNELVTRKIKFISSIHEEQSEENCSRKYGGLDTVASVNVKANLSGQTISCFSWEENLLIEQKKYHLMGLIYRSNRTTYKILMLKNKMFICFLLGCHHQVNAFQVHKNSIQIHLLAVTWGQFFKKPKR